jgi:hypothetical protein
MSKKGTLQKAAHELLPAPRFLFKVEEQMGAAGVIGEKRNRLALYLACLTPAPEKPVSMLVKGSTSSGKSNLVKGMLSVIPGDIVISRSSFSGKALAYGSEELAGKISTWLRKRKVCRRYTGKMEGITETILSGYSGGAGGNRTHA